MTISNGSLTDMQLIAKARHLLQIDSEWRYEHAFLSEAKNDLAERAKLAKARKDNYAFAREIDRVDARLYLLNFLIKHHTIDVYLVCTAISDRGLCARGEVYEYVGVWHE